MDKSSLHRTLLLDFAYKFTVLIAEKKAWKNPLVSIKTRKPGAIETLNMVRGTLRTFLLSRTFEDQKEMAEMCNSA